jgi:hypothetical protein
VAEGCRRLLVGWAFGIVIAVVGSGPGTESHGDRVLVY